MMCIFLSPHSDDAALSCGGLICQLVEQGDSVTVFTVMAGEMPDDMPLTPFIEEHIVRWKLGPKPVAARRVEDERALAILGANAQYGDIPDALYRTDGHGRLLYPDLEGLFGDPHPRDQARVDSVVGLLDSAAAVYAPLGAGNHVDHQLVREAALDWMRAHPGVAVFFYEEYPYSAAGLDAVLRARAKLAHPVEPVMHRISEAAMNSKIQAIACYQSQISTFWADVGAMDTATRDYARKVGGGSYAERLWQLA